jgi:hypothetical protein
MAELQEFTVRLSTGMTGTVQRTSRFLDKREFNTVKLNNGTEITVPSSSLEPQKDGTFFLHDERAEAQAQLGMRNGALPGGTPPDGQRNEEPDTRNEEPDTHEASLLKEDVDVQRIPVNRVLDRPVDTRIEDGVTIIPVMEERWKLEKQLILKEEIRIVKKRRLVHEAPSIPVETVGAEVNPRD